MRRMVLPLLTVMICFSLAIPFVAQNAAGSKDHSTSKPKKEKTARKARNDANYSGGDRAGSSAGHASKKGKKDQVGRPAGHPSDMPDQNIDKK